MYFSDWLVILFFSGVPLIILWAIGVILLYFAPDRRAVLNLLLPFVAILFLTFLLVGFTAEPGFLLNAIGSVICGIVWWVMFPPKRPIETPHPSCPHCGYNLTGNESGRCPECGNETTSTHPTGDADGFS